MTEAIVVAVDGPAASGKGTLCCRLAARLGFDVLDTGLLYRAVAAHCQRAGVSIDDEAAVGAYVAELRDINIVAEGLRDETSGRMASQVSRYPAVRAALLDYQRHFGRQPPSRKGAILDGRDIGTVIFPDTPYKIFLTAAIEVRAKRRFLELQNRKIICSYDRVLDETRRRDATDRNRNHAPLIPATDAVILDSGGLNPDQVLTQASETLYARGLRP